MKELLDKLRMSEWATLAAVLLCVIWWTNPQQLPVVVYKVALVSLFAHLGYLIDRRLFQLVRLKDADPEWIKAIYMRRAIIVGAVILGGALAL